ncbi:hypothetical protein [Nostoc sp.]|uniref:hypothetical protein n=1 Tax=Nostoc sp. TaxID=1180 RepID=UPI002FF35E85
MSAVEMLYINDTALNRVQFPLYNWLEINKTKYSGSHFDAIHFDLTPNLSPKRREALNFTPQR